MQKISFLFMASLLAALLLSCANQDTVPAIQDIANQWTAIEKQFSENETIDVKSIDLFYQTLCQFQQSELYRVYISIPFSPQIERSFGLYIPSDIREIEREVADVSDDVLIFRASVIEGDLEAARKITADISGVLIRLLMSDGGVQRFIASSYFNLFMTLAVFIIIIVLFAVFLYRALTHSLKREDEQTSFSHTYMLAQDEERLRISRELHDTIIQDMRFLLLETEKIGNTDEKNEREKLLGETVPMMADLIRKTRDMCNDLVPPDFRFSELPDALRRLCHETSLKTGIDCHAEIDENVKLDFLTMEKRLQVFRIVKEALSNVEKHSEAREAIVTMRSGQNGVIFIGISDDGKGFNSPLDINGQILAGIDTSHLGIISMKERATILGGVLKIITEHGGGGDYGLP